MSGRIYGRVLLVSATISASVATAISAAVAATITATITAAITAAIAAAAAGLMPVTRPRDDLLMCTPSSCLLLWPVFTKAGCRQQGWPRRRRRRHDLAAASLLPLAAGRSEF